MRFGTAIIAGRRRVVIVGQAGDRVWPVDELTPDSSGAVQGSMGDFIASYRGGLTEPAEGGYILGRDAALVAPIPMPARDIICVGKNYHDHALEFSESGFDRSASAAGSAIPQAPIVFGKSARSVVGPGAAIVMHEGVESHLDYEGELAIVIGKPGINIRAADARSHVFGYTIVNDVTARDLQQRHVQWYLGKSKDTFCPMGPWIVSADDFDADSETLYCRVNGEIRQSARLSDMIFGIDGLIEVISRGMQLNSGDIIATGTPKGVGIGFNPPQFLKRGDRVEVEITGIGSLTNTVVSVEEAQ